MPILTFAVDSLIDRPLPLTVEIKKGVVMNYQMTFRSICQAGLLALLIPGITLAEATLTIGSKAPELDIEHWISTGDPTAKPVQKFEPGKVYVVEFWATWCGPCVASMPHLAELQRKYKDQGVRIISVSDEDLSTVESFLKRKVPAGILKSIEEDETEKSITFGELTSAYSLTTDPDQSVYSEYMEAAGEDGIPTAFIVGKQGMVEWIGHPMEMDEPLQKIIADQWDRNKFIEERAEQQAVQQAIMQVYESLQEGKIELALSQLEKLIDSSQNKDLTAGLRMMQLDLLIQIDPPKAVNVLRNALSNLEDPQLLNAMAWSVVELKQADEAQELDSDLLKLAIQTAEKSVRLAPEDGMILDTLAHLVYLDGQLDRAIDLQTRVVKLAPEIEQFKEFLKELKEEKASK